MDDTILEINPPSELLQLHHFWLRANIEEGQSGGMERKLEEERREPSSILGRMRDVTSGKGLHLIGTSSPRYKIRGFDKMIFLKFLLTLSFLGFCYLICPIWKKTILHCSFLATFSFGKKIQ